MNLLVVNRTNKLRPIQVMIEVINQETFRIDEDFNYMTILPVTGEVVFIPMDKVADWSFHKVQQKEQLEDGSEVDGVEEGEGSETPAVGGGEDSDDIPELDGE